MNCQCRSIRRLFHVYTRDCRKNGGCKIEEQGDAIFREEERFPVAHPLPVKPVDLRRVARVLHPRVLPASRERNYLIITLNARLRPRESIYRRRRQGNDLHRAEVREGPEDDNDDDDGIYYGLVCVFKRQSPSPVRTTAIWSAGVAIDYR